MARGADVDRRTVTMWGWRGAGQVAAWFGVGGGFHAVSGCLKVTREALRRLPGGKVASILEV
jgi:hypothetical protein